jgi:hypothetical protein
MVDRPLVARLDAARVSFCLAGDHALVVHGCARRPAAVELLTVDPDVMRPLFWQGQPAPVTELGEESDHVVARLRWDGTAPDVLVVGRGHAMVYATSTARFDEELGVRVATPLGLVLTLLDVGGLESRADILDLVRAQESLLGHAWRPPVEEHLPYMSPLALAAWQQIELDLGAPT